jgi:hypothetical protein
MSKATNANGDQRASACSLPMLSERFLLLSIPSSADSFNVTDIHTGKTPEGLRTATCVIAGVELQAVDASKKEAKRKLGAAALAVCRTAAAAGVRRGRPFARTPFSFSLVLLRDARIFFKKRVTWDGIDS